MVNLLSYLYPSQIYGNHDTLKQMNFSVAQFFLSTEKQLCMPHHCGTDTERTFISAAINPPSLSKQNGKHDTANCKLTKPMVMRIHHACHMHFRHPT